MSDHEHVGFLGFLAGSWADECPKWWAGKSHGWDGWPFHLGFYQNFLVRVCNLLQKDWDCTRFKVQGLKNILDALSTIQGPGRAIKTGPVAEWIVTLGSTATTKGASWFQSSTSGDLEVALRQKSGTIACRTHFFLLIWSWGRKKKLGVLIPIESFHWNLIDVFSCYVVKIIEWTGCLHIAVSQRKSISRQRTQASFSFFFFYISLDLACGIIDSALRHEGALPVVWGEDTDATFPVSFTSPLPESTVRLSLGHSCAGPFTGRIIKNRY